MFACKKVSTKDVGLAKYQCLSTQSTEPSFTSLKFTTKSPSDLLSIHLRLEDGRDSAVACPERVSEHVQQDQAVHPDDL